jgi:hypothetical protein
MRGPQLPLKEMIEAMARGRTDRDASIFPDAARGTRKYLGVLAPCVRLSTWRLTTD